MSSIISKAPVSWPNSSRVRAGSKAFAVLMLSPRPRCETVATASVRRRSGRVTVAMISTASSVVSATTAPISHSAGRVTLMRNAAQRPSGSCSVCSTRYR